MSFHRDNYRIIPSIPLSLAEFPTLVKQGVPQNKDARKAYVAEHSPELGDLQEKLYGEGKRKFLLVLQGMDTAGKDGVIRRVFQAVNPLGIHVAYFKAPSANEQAHDFLWRVHKVVPKAGEMVIFNRSHYEDVLVQYVRGWIDEATCDMRLRHIREFEQMLVDTGTTIVKCFLHISKDEQRERLQARLDDATKHWKFDPNDLEDREYWDAYQAQYEKVIQLTSSEASPWYVIPSDSKSTRDYLILNLLIAHLEAMHIQLKEPDMTNWPKKIE